MKRIAHEMIVGGYLYGDLTIDSSRRQLMERLRHYVGGNGIPMDDPEEWDEEAEALTARLWRD